MSDTPLNPPPSVSGPGGLPEDEFERLEMTSCRLFRRSQITHLDRPMPWLWHGYLSRCCLTLLTGQWKLGKTTLLAALLARMGAGGELAGRRVNPGRVVVITEEIANLWLMRMAKHGIGDWVSFAFNPFVRKPLPRQWGYLLDDLGGLHARRRVDLVVIDPLVEVLPGREEASAQAMTDALRPLRDLAAKGPGVLILHHPRKRSGEDGQGSRGTGALPAFVDFLVEMHWAGPAGAENRRRRLLGWSRHEETPRRLLVELSADGTDYAAVPDDGLDEPPDPLGRALLGLLRAAPGRTAREVYAGWPAGSERPRLKDVERRLRTLLDPGRLERSAPGNRYAPYRYRLADATP
jgi:hypothetical protein